MLTESQIEEIRVIAVQLGCRESEAAMIYLRDETNCFLLDIIDSLGSIDETLHNSFKI